MFSKPFLTKKCFTGNNDITLIHKNKVISNENKFIKLFNSCYVNVIKKCSGTKPKTFGINSENTSVQSGRDILNYYKNHSSIIKIK